MSEDERNEISEANPDAEQNAQNKEQLREELKQELLQELRQEEEDRRYREQYYRQYPDRLPEREIVHTQTIVQEKRGMGGCLKAFLIFIAIIVGYNLVTAVLDPDKEDRHSSSDSKVTTIAKDTSRPNGAVTKWTFPTSQKDPLVLDEGENKQQLIYYTSTGKVDESEFKVTSSDSSVVKASIIEVTDTAVRYVLHAQSSGVASVWLTGGAIASKSFTVTVGGASVTTAPPIQETPKASYEVVDSYYYTGTNSIGTDWIKLFIVVENTGTANLYLHDMTVDFEDMSGKFVDNVTMVSACPQVIKPGERAVFYESTSKDTFKPNGKYNMIPHFDIKKATADYVRYETSDVTLQKDDYGGVKVTGRVKNSSSEARSLYVYTLLYDKSGKCIDVLFDITDNINPGEKMGFSMSNRIQYGYAELSEVASYKVYAYHDQWQLFD